MKDEFNKSMRALASSVLQDQFAGQAMYEASLAICKARSIEVFTGEWGTLTQDQQDFWHAMAAHQTNTASL